MRNENAQYFFIFALFSVLGSFPEGKPTTEPRKGTNSQAIFCPIHTPCHVEVNGKNLAMSLNLTKSPTLSEYKGACTSTCLTKIACLPKHSTSTKCVNESSTAASCNKNNLDMEYKQTLDGMFTVRVTGLKEQFRNWSPVYITAFMAGLSSDHQCVYNVSASAIRCSSLPAPLNGNKTGCTNITSEPYDAHCNFSCNVGYSLVGSPIRRCLENGTWSGETSHCQDRRSEKSPVLKIVVGSLVALFVVVAIIVGWFKFKTRKTRHVTEENVGPDNLAYGQRRRLLDDEFDMGLSQHVQQSDVNIDPERPANLPFSGAIVSRSEIENKESVLDLPNYGDETLNNHPPTSVPKYITRLEDTFTSTGGELCAPLESDVRIIVPSGAIPAGINQSVFFGFFFDETTLLRDIPEAADCSLISPVIECGPHGIHLLKPVEIIVPHCLDLNEAKKERITVYRCGQFFAQDYLNWEKVPNESEETSQSSQAVFTVKEDAIHIKTKTFSLLSIFACGGPRRKRATVFANRPDSQSDLIYLRFYVYSDNQDSKKRVELAEKERFPGSKPSREKPFRMYKDGRVITVKLTDLEEGWNFDKTKNTQIYGKGRGSGFRSTDACDFAVKPEDGRDVNGFSCNVKFQQEDDDLEHSIYLNPGFTPLKRQRTRQSSSEGDRSDSTSSTSQDWDHYVSTLGSEPVTEEHIYQISPHVGRDWKDVLRSLSMKKKAIENLSADYKYEKITEQCIQGLLKWKELKPESATIKILAGALLRVRCFDALQTLQNSIG